MMFTIILILIVARALPFIIRHLIHFTRISTILFIYTGVLIINTFLYSFIGSGIGIYSGLFQITQVSESLYSVIFTSTSITYSELPLLANNTMSLSYGMAIQGLSLGLILIFIGFLFITIKYNLIISKD